MRFITAAAIKRRTVTLLAVVIVLAAGVFAYNSLKVGLFPDIEFPLVAVTVAYPSVDPEGVVRDVTAPVERAISGADGLEAIRSTSFEGNTIVLATFRYGTDMPAAEAQIESAVSGISFPAGVQDPQVGRFDPDQFPVMSFSLASEDGLEEAVRILRTRILPEIAGLEGVMDVQVTGEVERQVHVAVDPELLRTSGIAMPQVIAALADSNAAVPSGLIRGTEVSVPVKTLAKLESIEDVRGLVVGSSPSGPVALSDVATVTLTDAVPASIYRANGSEAIGVSIVKSPEANTVEVSNLVREVLREVAGPLPGLEVVIVSDQGPQIQGQIDSLLTEAAFGFLFAVCVVFIFMLTIRPTVIRGLTATLRPTIVIGLTIPLSVLTAVLLMAWQDMSLNFMTLGGLTISVGRVVDDAIVVLENVYRHIQAGRERWRAALEATVEVGPAIFASTLATILVFIPLGFIEGLVGSFFLPFAITISFALAASLLVALTAVPVMAAYLLRPGDLPEAAVEDEVAFVHETWMQRAYTPVLRWALDHKVITLAGAAVATGASLILLNFIPVTLFPTSEDRDVAIELSLPAGTPMQRTLTEVIEIEEQVSGYSEIYTATVGATDLAQGGAPGSFNQASLLLDLNPDAPEDLANMLREDLSKPDLLVSVSEINRGPQTGGVEISISGPDYDDIATVSGELMESLATVDGVVNLDSDVATARDELSVEVDPSAAARLGLSARQVGLQLGQFLAGRPVTAIEVDGVPIDVVVSGDRRALASPEDIERLVISGPGGSAELGEIAEVALKKGPVTITRTDLQRSASITGEITSADTQAVGREIDERIEALSLPPGVDVQSGGIFADIEEGFQAIFFSIAVGIVLMYLVMVASQGSLRNPIVIVSSLPLALIGVLVSLAITGRTLGLPAMMGVLLLVGIVVTNAIVLISFVEQLRARGMPVREALITGGRVRLRPILMTTLTTSFALLPLATFADSEGGIIGAELATVVIGGLISSTGLTLIVVPIIYYLFNVSIPCLLGRGVGRLARRFAHASD